MSTYATVARRGDIKSGQPFGAKLGDDEIVLVEDRGTIRAFSGTCPHAGAPLKKGAVCKGTLICPFHKARFDITNGQVVDPPALEALKQYPVRIEGDAITVGHEPQRADTPPHIPTGKGTHVVLAGAGASGLVAALTLRKGGFAGQITMIGPEAIPPYDRTALSKVILSGATPLSKLPLLEPPEFFAQHNIDRITARISRLDADRKIVELEDGDALTYDTAYLATGSQAVSLDVDNSSMPGVHVLRTRDDAAAILDSVADNPDVVIVGGGFISLEAAASLRKRELNVTILTRDDVPLANRFGPDVAAGIKAILEAQGVKFVTGEVIELHGTDRVSSVSVTGGHRLKAGLLIVALGANPVTDFVDGVEKDDKGGIIVDASLLAAKSLYAGGDIAKVPSAADGNLVRIEHWRVAEQHGRVVADNILGRQRATDLVPFFWTLIAGERFEYLGHADVWDQIIVEGKPKEAKFIAFVVKDGHVDAVIAAGHDTETARLLMHINGRPDVVTARAIMAGKSDC